MNKKACLKDRSPELYAQWDKEKNKGMDVETVCPSHHILVWWKCSKGHSWQEYLNSRVYGSKRCPICAKEMPHKTTRSLAEQYPLIAMDWDYDMNPGKTPDTVAGKSGYRAAWKCHRCGRTWKTSVANRTVGATQCTCSRGLT